MVEGPPTIGESPTPTTISDPADSLKATTLSTPKNAKVKGEVPALEDDWRVEEFLKEAAYFTVEFGLPNEGENAFKINDISEAEMLECYQGKDKNG